MVAQGIVELLVMACSGWQCLDEYCGLVRVESGAGAWRASCSLCTLLGPEATRLRAYALKRCLFLVWCLRTVEWMRASLWSSC